MQALKKRNKQKKQEEEGGKCAHVKGRGSRKWNALPSKRCAKRFPEKKDPGEGEKKQIHRTKGGKKGPEKGPML